MADDDANLNQPAEHEPESEYGVEDVPHSHPGPRPGAATEEAERARQAARKVLPEAPPGLLNIEVNLSPEIEMVFVRPRFYRVVGRLSAMLSSFLLLLAMILAYWGFNLFVPAILFAIVFFIGEAVAAILERLEQIDSRPPK
jgi:hypothetical protein